MDKKFLNCGVLVAFALCVIVLFAGIFSYSSYKKYSDDFHNLTSKQEYETNSVEYKAIQLLNLCQSGRIAKRM